jgi:hypothetical protein
MLFYNRVHHWLRYGGFISLVVSASSVAYEIDHYVFLELIPEVDSQLGYENHSFRVVTINVEYRRLNHLSDVSAVLGGARVFLSTRGKADLIIDNNMQGAAGFVPAGLRHLKGLHDNTLARKCRVTVYHNRNNGIAMWIPSAILTCSHRALNHGGYNF